MKTTKKQQIIDSLLESLQNQANNGIEYCEVTDLTYSFINKDNEKKEYELELYSQFGSTLYEDKLACKWLKENGYLIKNTNYQLPNNRDNKWIIKTKKCI